MVNASDHQLSESGFKVVKPEAEIMTKQKLPNFVGISGATAGATAISMSMAIIPPVGKGEPHIHEGHETALYILKGRVKFRYGPNLQFEKQVEEGDFVFIAADVPHQPINMSDTEPVYIIVARNDPDEQESVRPYVPNGTA